MHNMDFSAFEHLLCLIMFVRLVSYF